MSKIESQTLFLSFQASWLTSHRRSNGSIAPPPDPEWDNDDIPNLIPVSSHLQWLKEQWLTVLIITDKKNQEGKAKVLGSG